MKDFTITVSRQKRELWTAGICLLIAILINAGAIIYYHTPFTELFSQIGYTVILALCLYAVYTAARILVWLIARIFKR